VDIHECSAAPRAGLCRHWDDGIALVTEDHAIVVTHAFEQRREVAVLPSFPIQLAHRSLVPIAGEECVRIGDRSP
jgi:hypothetical protein